MKQKYDDKARAFVRGLIKSNIPGAIRRHVLAQWILESGHFRSQLATQFNNAGGMQYRKGYTGPHEKAIYVDWQGKEALYFALDDAEQYCDLYLWFIGRERYERAVSSTCPLAFIFELADAGYVADMPKPELHPHRLHEMLLKVGADKFYRTGELIYDYEPHEMTYKESIPWNYLHRIQSIANRPETTELLRHEWTDKVGSMMGKENEIQHEDEEAPEWMGLYVDGEE